MIHRLRKVGLALAALAILGLPNPEPTIQQKGVFAQLPPTPPAPPSSQGGGAGPDMSLVPTPPGNELVRNSTWPPDVTSPADNGAGPGPDNSTPPAPGNALPTPIRALYASLPGSMILENGNGNTTNTSPPSITQVASLATGEPVTYGTGGRSMVLPFLPGSLPGPAIFGTLPINPPKPPAEEGGLFTPGDGEGSPSEPGNLGPEGPFTPGDPFQPPINPPINPPSVPEPGAMSLLAGAASAGLLMQIRRLRRAR